MRESISVLENALFFAENEERTHRIEGRTSQADIALLNIAEYKWALAILMAVSDGPIYPSIGSILKKPLI